MAEAGKVDHEAYVQTHVEQHTRENDNSDVGQVLRVSYGVVNRRHRATDQVERYLGHEQEEAGQPKPARQMLHFQIMHKKPPFFAHNAWFCGRWFLRRCETRTL
jgi:hypothetical protein